MTGQDQTDAADTTANGITVVVGGDSASAQVDPTTPTTVELDDSDGSSYVLNVPAFALSVPTTVTVKQITTAAISGLSLAGGVEIQPAGLQLALPATLMLNPATDVNPDNAIAIVFAGDQPQARLAQLAADQTNGLSILLTHFSGGLTGGLDPTGENLWLQQGTFNTDTIAGRQAQALHGIAVLDWAEQQGKIDHDSAESSRETWRTQWWEAQQQKEASDLKQTIDAGNIDDAATVIAQAAEMVKVGEQVNPGDQLASGAVAQAVQLLGQWGVNVVNRLNTDPTFQHLLDAGLISNMGDVSDVINTLLGIARSQGILGDTAASDQILKALDAWMKKFTESLLESCKYAPLDVSTVLGLLRQAEQLGDTSIAASLEDCIWDDTHVNISGNFHGTYDDPLDGTSSMTEQIDLDLELPATLIRQETDPNAEHPIIGWVNSYSLSIQPLAGCQGCIAACSTKIPDMWTGADVGEVVKRSPGHVQIRVHPAAERDQMELCLNALGSAIHYTSFLINFDLDPYGAVLDASLEPSIGVDSGLDYGVQITILPTRAH